MVDVYFFMDIDVAKHMRLGRQEDAHEYMRYLVEALQKSCLQNVPKYVTVAPLLSLFFFFFFSFFFFLIFKRM